MNFKNLTVLAVPEEVQATTGFVARIFADIENVPATGLPLSAELGSQRMEALGVVQGLEPLLSGFVRAVPQPGDELVIKIGEVTIPTGLTVGDPAIA
jgi:hypothetical protein